MKKLKKEKIKTNKSRLIIIGSFLIIGICTLTISLTLLNNYKNDKEEDKNLNVFFEVQEQINIEQKEVIEGQYVCWEMPLKAMEVKIFLIYIIMNTSSFSIPVWEKRSFR